MNKPINIDIATLNKSHTEFCKCGCPFFKTRIILKRLNGLLLGAGKQNVLFPVNLLVCESCGELHNASNVQYNGLEIPALGAEMAGFAPELKEPKEGGETANNGKDAKLLKL